MPCKLTTLMLLLTHALLSGCASLKLGNPPESRPAIPLSPPISPARRIVQQITARWPNHLASILCILELDQKRIALACMDNNGIGLFNLKYDGNKMALEKALMLPENVVPEYIIRDLQLAYWPMQQLQKSLPDDWHITGGNHCRRLYFKGRIETEVDYLKPDKIWPKSVSLTNHPYHYQLLIDTVRYETVPQ